MQQKGHVWWASIVNREAFAITIFGVPESVLVVMRIYVQTQLLHSLLQGLMFRREKIMQNSKRA
jgi:hypothetical protein